YNHRLLVLAFLVPSYFKITVHDLYQTQWIHFWFKSMNFYYDRSRKGQLIRQKNLYISDIQSAIDDTAHYS
ncbi:hypothetical protein, partial [Staphylococcus aureus]